MRGLLVWTATPSRPRLSDSGLDIDPMPEEVARVKCCPDGFATRGPEAEERARGAVDEPRVHHRLVRARTNPRLEQEAIAIAFI